MKEASANQIVGWVDVLAAIPETSEHLARAFLTRGIARRPI